MKKFGNDKKFSIVEGLLVLIFTVIVGSGFVAYQNMVNNGNESNACSFINSIHQKQKKHALEHQGVYAQTFQELGEAGEGKAIVVDGYVFKMEVKPQTESKSDFYTITGDPEKYLYFFDRGSRHFYFDSTLATTKSTQEKPSGKRR